MKAITLTQPWATLVAVGAKHVETRSWTTAYRGPLAIHAAKSMPAYAQDACYGPAFVRFLREHGYPDPGRAAKVLPRGEIVAVCDLWDVLPIVATRDVRSGVVTVDRTRETGTRDGVVRVWPPSTLKGPQLICGSSCTWDRDEDGSGAPSPVDYFGEQESSFGDYTPGRYAWLLHRIRPLRVPVPARGSLGLWTLNDDDARCVREETHE